MSKRIGIPSPAMVIACIALFAALGSGAYAASKAAKNSVVSKSIKNGAVKSADIADGGVRQADLAAGAVTAAALAPGAVGSGALADGAVTPSKLSAGAFEAALADVAVNGSKLVDGSVGAAEIAGDAVGARHLASKSVGAAELAGIVFSTAASPPVADGDLNTNSGAVGIAKATAQCPAGTRLLWGGSRWIDPTTPSQIDGNVYIQEEHIANQETSWSVQGIVDIGAQGTIRLEAQAYCLKAGLN